MTGWHDPQSLNKVLCKGNECPDREKTKPQLNHHLPSKQTHTVTKQRRRAKKEQVEQVWIYKCVFFLEEQVFPSAIVRRACSGTSDLLTEPVQQPSVGLSPYV